MGRRPREEEDGGIYHVIQRGNNREFVFDDDRDKEYMIGQLMLLSRRGCIVYGYVLMGNHYHLVLKTGGELLQTVMHRLNLKYSKYFNSKYTRSGHVFQGRYKAMPRDEKYILGLVRYVHQNPVKAGVCKRTEEYNWSSDRQYRDIKNKNGWTDTEFVLEMFSVNRETEIKRYKEFMGEAETGDFEKTEAIGDNTDKGKERAYKETALMSLDKILLSTGLTEQEYKLIKSGSRRRNLTEYKLKYSKEALQLNYTLKAIGNNIKVSEAAIFDLIKRNNLIS